MAIFAPIEPRAVGPPPAARPGSHRVVGFIARRVAAGMATLLVASFVIFFATNVLPGDVASAVLGRNATPANMALLRLRLHLTRPVLVRYGDWIIGVAHGDLGQSAVALGQGAQSAPVSHMIATPMINTLILAGVTIVALIPLSLLLGVLAGYLVWSNKVETVPASIALIERLFRRSLGPDGREILMSLPDSQPGV